jgi:cell division protein ZapA
MNKTEVFILGHRYTIKGEKPSDHVKNLAAYVDEKLKSVYEQNPNLTPLRAAILACFYVADELEETKKTLQETMKKLQEIEAKTNELMKLLD